jgi:hypothetical protein
VNVKLLVPPILPELADCFSFDQTMGILYLDASPQSLLDENHLQLVTGIADIVATPLKNV